MFQTSPTLFLTVGASLNEVSVQEDVTVKLVDVNDETPVFEGGSYTVEVSEVTSLLSHHRNYCWWLKLVHFWLKFMCDKRLRPILEI